MIDNIINLVELLFVTSIVWLIVEPFFHKVRIDEYKNPYPGVVVNEYTDKDGYNYESGGLYTIIESKHYSRDVKKLDNPGMQRIKSNYYGVYKIVTPGVVQDAKFKEK